jgi:hypothetical protein
MRRDAMGGFLSWVFESAWRRLDKRTLEQMVQVETGGCKGRCSGN